MENYKKEEKGLLIAMNSMEIKQLANEGLLAPQVKKKMFQEWMEEKDENVKVMIAGKYDANGKQLSEVMKKENEKHKEEMEEVEEVAKIVAEGLTRKCFHLLEVNFFTKVDESSTFVPAEISVVKFCIKEGIVSLYHAFPEAGVIPLGAKWECMRNSAKSHQIPLEKFMKEELKVDTKSDYRILEEIEEYLDGEDSVFVMTERKDQCQGVLNTISSRSSVASPVKKYLQLPELFYKLVNQAGMVVVVPYVSILEQELNNER